MNEAAAFAKSATILGLWILAALAVFTAGYFWIRALLLAMKRDQTKSPGRFAKFEAGETIAKGDVVVLRDGKAFRK